MRSRELLRNAVLTTGFARHQLLVDPAGFMYKTLQRMDRRVIAFLSPCALRVQRRWPTRLGALVLAAAGQPTQLRGEAAKARTMTLPPYRTAALADAALALGEHDAATRLLAASTGVHWPPAAVRLARYMGDSSRALSLASTLGRRGKRLRREIEGELSVFTGNWPRIPPVGAYSAVPGRILFVGTSSLPHTQSGYAQRTHSVMCALRADGWNVAAVTRIGYPVEIGRIGAADMDVVDGIRYQRLLPWTVEAGLDARLEQQARALARIVEDHRPQILHTTTDFTNAAIVQAVARAYGIPWVYEVRGQLADSWAATRPPSALGSEYYRNFGESEARAARAADAIVTLGHQMHRRLVGAGVDPEVIVLCPNAVGEAFEREPKDVRSVRTAIGLELDAEYVGSITSVVDYEGLDDLVRAVALLAPSRPRLRMLIAGDGVALSALRKLADDLGVQERCVFVGRVPRSVAVCYYQALDVFVLPRKDHGVTRDVTPLKPVEASAAGKPIVASDLPALREHVMDGVNGLLVPPQDPQRVANAMAFLLDHPMQATRMGATGRREVLTERTWNGVAKKYTRLYQSVLQRAER